MVTRTNIIILILIFILVVLVIGLSIYTIMKNKGGYVCSKEGKCVFSNESSDSKSTCKSTCKPITVESKAPPPAPPPAPKFVCSKRRHGKTAWVEIAPHLPDIKYAWTAAQIQNHSDVGYCRDVTVTADFGRKNGLSLCLIETCIIETSSWDIVWDCTRGYDN